MKPILCATVLCSTLFLMGSIDSQETAKPDVFLNEEAGGIDFRLQGEYLGAIQTQRGDLRVGLQVIARGKGEFETKAYTGGLPGDGWNREAPDMIKSRREEKTLKITSEKGTAIILGDVAVIRNPDGMEVGTLKKVRRKSPTLGAKPPAGAIVLFDGSSTKQFVNGHQSAEGWLVQGTRSKLNMGSFQLHLEFRLPFVPEESGQRRGNSGCYMQSRYEIQMLDSFGLSGEHNECGGIYSVKKPDVNMCFPPLSWQTYDVEFTAAKFNDAGEKTDNARITVKHNGMLIHNDVEIPHATTASPLPEGPEPGPLYLQDHDNEVRYRNIWVLPRKG